MYSTQVVTVLYASAVKLAGFLARNLSRMLEELGVEDFVREKVVKDQWTHDRVSRFLRESTGMVRGLSERSVRRFCASKEIKRTSRVDDRELDFRVERAISLVSNCCNNNDYVGNTKLNSRLGRFTDAKP